MRPIDELALDALFFDNSGVVGDVLPAIFIIIDPSKADAVMLKPPYAISITLFVHPLVPAGVHPAGLVIGNRKANAFFFASSRQLLLEKGALKRVVEALIENRRKLFLHLIPAEQDQLGLIPGHLIAIDVDT